MTQAALTVRRAYLHTRRGQTVLRVDLSVVPAEAAAVDGFCEFIVGDTEIDRMIASFNVPIEDRRTK